MESTEEQLSFLIQKVYTKDISFESINSPTSFKDDWNPSSKFNIKLDNKKIDNKKFTLDLKIIIETKNKNINIYKIEVIQTGIFTISGISKEQVEFMLNTYCANTLFPYAKRIIDSSITKSGFLPPNITPINFDAIYAKKKAKDND